MKIEIEHVSKKIKDALVLDDVCMTLESGNIYGFQGVNGSGKTMLMRAVSGLMYPTSGTISIDGKVLGKNMAFPEKIGMLIENPAFIDSYTGYDNLKMLASINKGEVDISRALETVGLNPQDKRKYRKYSLGMKQRLGIACAIMEEPKLLLLDEHTAALDPKTAAKVLEISDKIIAENHLTAMMVTHNMRDAIAHGNRLIMMHEGKVILNIAGEEKKKLTVEDLLHQFERVSGEEFANDKALLS